MGEQYNGKLGSYTITKPLKVGGMGEVVEATNQNGEEVVEQPKKERKSFLDKLTERVKDFLDNAE
mgnify:CR=1 FL=1